jgi:aminopeptidase
MTTTDAVHYQPSREILDRYAEVLVRFALGSGRGIQPGEMVYIRADEVAKPLLESVHDAVVDADGHPHVEFVPEGMLRRFLERGSETQLGYWPKNLELGRVADAHHRLGLFIYDPREFDGLEASRYGAYRAARKELTDAWTAKELRGEHTWSLCLYPTDRQAREAGLSLEESWAQVIKACYLDDSDPVRRWREVFRQLEETKQKLDARGIESLRVRGEGIDLRLRIGDGKRWQGGEGRNIPSFEIFNTPDCRVGEGEVHFDLPGFHHGQVIRGAQLRFEAGRVVEFSAEAGAEVLAQIVGASGGDRLGEFSLTDRRLSRTRTTGLTCIWRSARRTLTSIRAMARS